MKQLSCWIAYVPYWVKLHVCFPTITHIRLVDSIPVCSSPACFLTTAPFLSLKCFLKHDLKTTISYPTCSMYGTFTIICPRNHPSMYANMSYSSHIGTTFRCHFSWRKTGPRWTDHFLLADGDNPPFLSISGFFPGEAIVFHGLVHPRVSPENDAWVYHRVAYCTGIIMNNRYNLLWFQNILTLPCPFLWTPLASVYRPV